MNYDLFRGPLDAALWGRTETNSNFAVISNTETQRAVVKPDPLVANSFHQLALTTRHSGSGSGTGEAGQGRQRCASFVTTSLPAMSPLPWATSRNNGPPIASRHAAAEHGDPNAPDAPSLATSHKEPSNGQRWLPPPNYLGHD